MRALLAVGHRVLGLPPSWVEARVSTAAPAPPAPPPLPLPPPRQMRLPGLGLRVCAAQRTCGLSISCAR
ncbi:hypothetical protein AURDEDRAFT_114156 [Auricularia subglabra TFB-10046 SS5]|nr:hypothetical protein AURDEDRAFT_114156 [Auricularia subglabra TFB-10046 SS5]